MTCECGESAKLDHGEHWTCPGCDRAYDTSRIPRAEYDVIRRAQLRFRALPIALGLVVLALAVLFTLTDRPVNVFILLPLALMAWFLFLRPAHQKRYRRAISELPRWDLRADGG